MGTTTFMVNFHNTIKNLHSFLHVYHLNILFLFICNISQDTVVRNQVPHLNGAPLPTLDVANIHANYVHRYQASPSSCQHMVIYLFKFPYYFISLSERFLFEHLQMKYLLFIHSTTLNAINFHKIIVKMI